MHTWMASPSCVDVVAVELGRVGEGREPGPVADLVGEQAADARRDVLVAEEPVEAHRVLREERREGGLVDRVGVGAEAEQRRLLLGVAGDHPHAGLALGAGLGEQQRPAVGEAPAGLAEARLGGLLLVRLEAPALHEVDDEGELAEVEQQVLAPPADEHELLAVGAVGGGRGRLQGGEGQRREALERRCRRRRRRGARRGPGSRGAQARAAREHVVDRWPARRLGRSRPAGRRRAAAGPRMKAAWADSSPRWMASAVARSWVKVTSGVVGAARSDRDRAVGRRRRRRRPRARRVRRGRPAGRRAGGRRSTLGRGARRRGRRATRR